MDTNFPPTRQWTIRIVPWLLLLIGAAFIIAITVILLITRDQICGMLIALLLAIVVTGGLAEFVTCQLDLDARMVTLRQANIIRRTRQQFAFDDIQTISVQRNSDGESTTYRLVFVLKSGESIPLTSTTSSGKGGKEKLAQQITAYINQARLNPINPALDGVVRVENQGETDGVRWQIAFVTANDDVPLTRWHTADVRFPGGFLLLMPATGAKTTNMPGGLAGSMVRMVYGQYLRMLDLAEQDLPGFENAQIIPGEQVGLEKRFTILSSDPAAGKAWLTPERTRPLSAWTQSNPLKGVQAARGPHLWFTSQGMWMAFRGQHNQPKQVAAIAQLGADLVQA